MMYQKGFHFTVKISKEITHVKKLNAEFKIVERFINAANHLGNNKGCLLIQFPGSITLGYESDVEKIISNIKKADNKNEWRMAVEFRNSTWYTERTKTLLNRYQAALVLHDMPKSINLEIDKKAGFYYFRFHGPKGDYRGSYSDSFIEEQAMKIENLLTDKKDVYAYFNNTMESTFENAMTLNAKVEKLLN